MSEKYFYKEFKVGPFEIITEGALTHHVLGLGSVEWSASRAKAYQAHTEEIRMAPAYLTIDTNLPFSWIRVSIEKDNK